MPTAEGKTKQANEGKSHDLSDVGVFNLRSQERTKRRERFETLKKEIQKYSIMGLDPSGNKRRKDYKPEEFAFDIQQGIFAINSMINEIGAPFGGAGSVEWFAEARLGWQLIYGQMASMAETLFSLLELKDNDANLVKPDDEQEILILIKKANSLKDVAAALRKNNPLSYAKNLIDERLLNNSKMELVRAFFTFYQVEYIGWAQFMHDLCWDKEQEYWAVTIYQPPSMGMGRENANLGGLQDPNNNNEYG